MQNVRQCQITMLKQGPVYIIHKYNAYFVMFGHLLLDFHGL